jgi:two-component system, OmpR family, sensor histidine kinase MtrB
VAEDGDPDVVSMASHQIRGPLGILVGSLQTAAEHWEELDDDARRQMVERGFGQSRRLLRRVENLLALAQSERGAAPDVDRRTVNVCDVIRHALVDARKLDGEVLVDCPEEFHAMVDPDHLTQIVGNFVDNAFRHGRPPVAVRASATDHAIEIAVIDHGDGIPADHADGLFHLPGQNPTPVLTAGSGLGLYITRLLAEANGGAVHHAPNSPTGTQMIVRVPRADVASRREA